MNITHLFLGQICMQNAACGLFTWMTNGLFGFKKTITHHLSLLTQFSSLITPHSSLKNLYFLWDPLPEHHVKLTVTIPMCILSLPINHIFSFFFFLFFHHSPPIPRHTVQTLLRPSILFLSPSPNNANFHLTEFKQRRSLAKEIHPALIST